MSIFSRPDSPPPRAPSPDIIHAPLPSPYLRPRFHSSSSQHSVSTDTPFTPPGLNSLNRSHKKVLTVRSLDHLNASPSCTGQKRGELEKKSRATRSSPSASPPTTPRSLQLPSTVFSPHRRLSDAIPYRSPPLGSTLLSPPPPVPPIPAFVLAPSSYNKSILPAHSGPIMPIQLPELDNLSPLSDSTHSSVKRIPVSSQKQRSVGMTCLKFFTLRNSKRRGQTSRA